MSAAKVPARGPLAGNVRADICIVGSGIAGLTIAYGMARGRKIVVLDDGPIAGGELPHHGASMQRARCLAKAELESEAPQRRSSAGR